MSELGQAPAGLSDADLERHLARRAAGPAPADLADTIALALARGPRGRSSRVAFAAVAVAAAVTLAVGAIWVGSRPPTPAPLWDPHDEPLTATQLETLFDPSGDPIAPGAIVVADVAIVDPGCLGDPTCPDGAIDGASPQIGVRFEGAWKLVYPPPDAFALRLRANRTVGVIGTISKGPTGWVRTMAEYVNSPDGLVLLDAWLVGTGAAQPSCPSAGSPTPTSRPDAPDFGCGAAAWLTPREYQPTTITAGPPPAIQSMTVVPPEDGARAQNGAYREFAPNPQRRDGLDVPRRAVYLVGRARCPDGASCPYPTWAVLGRVDPILPPDPSAPRQTASPTPSPTSSPAIARPDANVDPDTALSLATSAVEAIAADPAVAPRIDPLALVPALVSVDGDVAHISLHDYATGDQVWIDLDLRAHPPAATWIDYPSAKLTGPSAFERERVDAILRASAEIERVLPRIDSIVVSSLGACAGGGMCAGADVTGSSGDGRRAQLSAIVNLATEHVELAAP